MSRGITPMTIADSANSSASKIANSVLLLAIARLSTVGIIPVVLALAMVSWVYISYRFDVQMRDTAAAATVAADAANNAAVVASDLTRTKQSLSDELQNEVQFRSETKNLLDKHGDTLVTISNELSGISAKIDTWHRQGQP